ncbi:Nodule Cysteine-Rich [Sesbania bispinosa]|nr:Nodule Cysteine-Rich [Sesbania bispinosa]
MRWPSLRLVADDDEADLFMDPYGLRRMLAVVPSKTGKTSNQSRPGPDCPHPVMLYGATTCLGKQQILKTELCKGNNPLCMGR